LAWAGAVIGDNIGYVIGRTFGRAVVLRFGGRIGITADRLRKVEDVFARYGPVTVGFARFFPILRQLNGVVAGTLAMEWRRFLLFNALGGALWGAGLVAAGILSRRACRRHCCAGARFWDGGRRRGRGCHRRGRLAQVAARPPAR
jgi:membrane protein DedA with SNARE-associated domain